MIDKIPQALEDLILDAASEGYKIKISRQEIPNGFTTMIELSHPKGRSWAQTGFPDFFTPEMWKMNLEALKKTAKEWPPLLSDAVTEKASP